MDFEKLKAGLHVTMAMYGQVLDVGITRDDNQGIHEAGDYFDNLDNEEPKVQRLQCKFSFLYCDVTRILTFLFLPCSPFASTL